MKNDSNETASEFVIAIRKYLLEHYEPVQDPKKAEFHYTTTEIYNQLQKLLPGKKKYKPADIATWLHSAGFVFCDYGFLQFEWMFKSKQK